MSQLLDPAARLDPQRASDLDRSDAQERSLTMDYTLPDPHAAAPVCEPLSQTAIEIGEDAVLANMELFGSFISECDGGYRLPSWFGPISTYGLITEILGKPQASDEQIVHAWKELRKRYLDEHSEYIREAAERAMR